MTAIVVKNARVQSFFESRKYLDPETFLIAIVTALETVLPTEVSDHDTAVIDTVARKIDECKGSFPDLLKTFTAKLESVSNLAVNTVSRKVDECKSSDSLRLVMDSVTTANARVESRVESLALKLEGSQCKGKLSENVLSTVLSTAFPEADVIDNTGTPGSCDFRLVRNGLSDILFENKNYTRNVNTQEVQKFIGDCKSLKTPGILVSQESGIAGHPNWDIQVIDGVGVPLLFVHKLKYDTFLVKTAVQIMDLLIKINGNGNGTGSGSGNSTDKNTGDKDTLAALVTELQSELSDAVSDRDSALAAVRAFSRDSTKRINKSFKRVERIIENTLSQCC